MLINVLHLLFGVKCFRVTLILMKYLIAVVALAVCCIVIPVDGQTAGEHPNAHQKNGGKPKETPPNTVNVETVNVNKINVPQQPDPARKPDQDSQKSPSYLHRLIAPEGLPNLVLCLVGIAGVIAAFCTLQEIQATGKQTDRMIKLEQRAWIQTHSPMAVGINALNPIRGYLRFRNGGRTPGLKVKAFCSVIRLERGLSLSGTVEDRADINPIIPSDGMDAINIPETVISTSDWTEMLAGKLDFFIWGKIMYDDIFNVHHWLEFCYVVDCKSESVKLHHEHNEIDSNE